MFTSAASSASSSAALGSTAVTGALALSAFVAGKVAASLLGCAVAWVGSTRPIKRSGHTISSFASMFRITRRRSFLSKLSPEDRVKNLVLSSKVKDPYATAPQLKTTPKELAEQALELAKDAVKTPYAAGYAKTNAQEAERTLKRAYEAQEAQEKTNDEIESELPWTDLFSSPQEQEEIRRKLALIESSEKSAANAVVIAEENVKNTTVTAQLAAADGDIKLTTLVKAIGSLSYALQIATQNFLIIVKEKQTYKAKLAKLKKDDSAKSDDKKAIRKNIEKLEKAQKVEHKKILDTFTCISECESAVQEIHLTYKPVAGGTLVQAHPVLQNNQLKNAFNDLTQAAARQKTLVDKTAAEDIALAAEDYVHGPTIAPRFFHKFIHEYRAHRAQKLTERITTLAFNAREAATYAELVKDPAQAAQFKQKRANIRNEAEAFRRKWNDAANQAQQQYLILLNLKQSGRHQNVNYTAMLQHAKNLFQHTKKEELITAEVVKIATDFATSQGHVDNIEKAEALINKLRELQKARKETEKEAGQLAIARGAEGIGFTREESTALDKAQNELSAAINQLAASLPLRSATVTVRGADLTYREAPEGEPGFFSKVWTAVKGVFKEEDIYRKQVLV